MRVFRSCVHSTTTEKKLEHFCVNVTYAPVSQVHHNRVWTFPKITKGIDRVVHNTEPINICQIEEAEKTTF